MKSCFWLLLNIFLFFSPRLVLSQKTNTNWSLVTTGDIIPARSVNAQAVRRQNYFWPYQNLASFLKKADLTVINLEAPLIKNCPTTDEGMIFCGSFEHAKSLQKSGIDIVNLANNHSGNYGKSGIEETMAILKKNKIAVVGVKNSQIKKIKNLKIGFLGYNDIEKGSGFLSDVDFNTLQKDLKNLKPKVDLLIVFFHWGDEYTSQPNKRQIQIAHFAVDQGADLILGNHPHWIQAEETYKNKQIFYALGNTIFDQMWSEETKVGLLVKIDFSQTKIISIEYIPTYIENYGQPRLLTGAGKKKILEKFKQESLKLAEKKVK